VETDVNKSKTILYVGPDSELRDHIEAQVNQSERDLGWETCDTVQEISNLQANRRHEALILDGRISDRDELIAFLESSQERTAPARILIYANHASASALVHSHRRPQTYLLDENRVARFSIILERALEHRQLRQRLLAISQIARAIASTFDIDQIFEIVGTRLRNLIEFRRLSLRVLNEDSGCFDTWDIELRGRRPITNTDKDVQLSTDETHILNDVLQSQEVRVLFDDIPKSMQMVNVGAYALIPLVGTNDSNGVLAVGFPRAPIEDETLEILQDLSVHLYIALQNARAYKQLDAAQNQLFRSEKLHVLGELAAGVAHDFNNLLSAILGRAQMLKITMDDEEALRSVDIIEQAAIDGARTVARIQEYAKASATTDFIPLAIDSLVEETVERAKGSVRARERENLTVRLDLQCPASVLGNLSELRQVLTNLIFNAVDAMTLGGELSVSSGIVNEGKTAWFAVTDQGTGMDPATLGKIFNPFFTTKGQEGTGLGLSVSNSIIERHLGRFDVSSVVDTGTTVKVCLPTCDPSVLDKDIIDPRERWSPTPVPPAKNPNAKSNARILVIDDDDNVLDVLAEILRTGNHTVVPAKHGSQGLQIFQESEFDLVFTDLGMPDMNGWEVASKIKSIKPDIPIGLITGWGASLDEGRMKESGVDLIVSKPFRYHEVLDLVTEAMTYKDGLDS
jgi:signal transduction histidine kinase/ActR/RegA family two-component response regulator